MRSSEIETIYYFVVAKIEIEHLKTFFVGLAP